MLWNTFFFLPWGTPLPYTGHSGPLPVFLHTCSFNTSIEIWKIVKSWCARNGSTIPFCSSLSYNSQSSSQSPVPLFRPSSSAMNQADSGTNKCSWWLYLHKGTLNLHKNIFWCNVMYQEDSASPQRCRLWKGVVHGDKDPHWEQIQAPKTSEAYFTEDLPSSVLAKAKKCTAEYSKAHWIKRSHIIYIIIYLKYGWGSVHVNSPW